MATHTYNTIEKIVSVLENMGLRETHVSPTASEDGKVKIADISVNGTAYPIYSDGLTEAEKTELITLIEAL